MLPVLPLLLALDGPTQAVDVHVVVGSTSAREDLLVPLAFTGPTVGLGARYHRRRGDGQLDVDLGAELALLHDRYGHSAGHLAHRLGVDYLRWLRDDLALGPLLRLGQDLTYVDSWDDAHMYWLAGITLGPRAELVRTWGSKAVVRLAGDVALLALSSRPPERRLNKQDGMTHVGYAFDRFLQSPALALPWVTQQVRLELDLRARHADGTAGPWAAGVDVRFIRQSTPAPYAMLFVGVTVSRRWGW